VPLPEDFEPLPDFEPGDEAARAAMLPSPSDDEEMTEWCGCCGCDCEGEGGWYAQQEGEGEYGYSPRSFIYPGVVVAEEEGEEGKQEEDDDPPTDDDEPFDALEQGVGAAHGQHPCCGRCGLPQQPPPEAVVEEEVEVGPVAAAYVVATAAPMQRQQQQEQQQQQEDRRAGAGGVDWSSLPPRSGTQPRVAASASAASAALEEPGAGGRSGPTLGRGLPALKRHGTL
jgi:hypothetical protein